MKVLVLTMLLAIGDAQDMCVSETNTYTVKPDLFAGELGYFTFEECGDTPNPTIGLELGQSYSFIQSDISSWFHPLGFAYFPDGDHDDKDELEPGISHGTSDCATLLTCPAPMYFMGETYLGEYSNDPSVRNVTTGVEDFGIDAYEPLFYRPIPEWVGLGNFSIKLNFDDSTFADDIFYFCHIHQYMTGRIKILVDGNPVNENNEPELGYAYDQRGVFDTNCGTTGLENYQLPNPECLDRFVCGADELGGDLAAFSECIEATNCAMMAGMTTGVTAASEAALFIHQMIPHHQNAVNMAKALLKTGKVACDDLTQDTPDCVLQVILREIVNGQNIQIQLMRGYLKDMSLPMTDDCQVRVAEEVTSGACKAGFLV